MEVYRVESKVPHPLMDDMWIDLNHSLYKVEV